MVIKVYVSRVSGNMEMKKRQEFIMNLLASKQIEYQEVDISDPTKEEEKMFMRKNATPEEGKQVPLAPQVFNEEAYCGDYNCFHEANECEVLYEFLKMAPEKNVSQAAITLSETPDHDSDEENRKPKRDYGDPTLDMLSGQIRDETEHVDNDNKTYDQDNADDRHDFGNDNEDNVRCGGGSDQDEPEEAAEADDDGLGDGDDGADEDAVNGAEDDAGDEN